jgi:hypothetical protein
LLPAVSEKRIRLEGLKVCRVSQVREVGRDGLHRDQVEPAEDLGDQREVTQEGVDRLSLAPSCCPVVAAML